MKAQTGGIAIAALKVLTKPLYWSISEQFRRFCQGLLSFICY
jgi:hypothetical protein